MFKKQLLLVVTVVFLTVSCGPDDDPRDNYPQNKDISFVITSSDNNRQSDITLAIQGKGIDVSDFSSGESHLPFTKDYLNQKIAFLTTLDITYRDNSGGEVGVSFEPYNIKLKISADSETLTEKEITITESGTTDFVDFTFN
ncbi:hypothetical protein MWU65_13645 [Cellulophaga sp. F20128]|uniref:hypothetical protein n=1 Tax=Cellulophaga sp. F20128 TaxID=2926413 RepID=UPI001FF543D2|nr:hypothetical protein [Cellulophaga sp. F20128]MCK0158233.1 hypothetical protein [Cellulophaga sp. F20128]